MDDALARDVRHGLARASIVSFAMWEFTHLRLFVPWNSPLASTRQSIALAGGALRYRQTSCTKALTRHTTRQKKVDLFALPTATIAASSWPFCNSWSEDSAASSTAVTRSMRMAHSNSIRQSQSCVVAPYRHGLSATYTSTTSFQPRRRHHQGGGEYTTSQEAVGKRARPSNIGQCVPN